MPPELRYVLSNSDELAREHAANFRHGRALIPTVTDLERLTDVRLVLERSDDGATLGLHATVVMVLTDGPVTGTALELALDESCRKRLDDFVSGGVGDGPAARSVPARVPDDADFALPSLADPDFALDAASSDADGEGATDEGTDGAPARASNAPPDSKIMRIRHLNNVDRMRLALTGHLEERVMLERVYGKTVWEELLRNPGITVPEVAKIAAKGTAPRVLLEQIVDNQAWSRQSIVRRALLANPRLGIDCATKLLRATPKIELKAIAHTNLYPLAVRTLAKKFDAE